MKSQDIAAEALELPAEERAEMAQGLLLSLDSPSDGEIAADWLVEARRRAQDIDEGIVEPVPAEEARHKALRLLR